MMRHLSTVKILGLALLVLFLVGCRTAPVYNVDDAPITTSSSSQPSMEEIREAIVQAGTSLGWRMEPQSEGHIVGTLQVRDHMAKVDVNYTASSYDITYKDSSELKYDGDKIHKNYNGWIQNLDEKIRARLIAM